LEGSWGTICDWDSIANTNGGLQNGYEKVLFIPFCCLLGVTVTTEKEKTASVGTTGIHVTLGP